MSRRHSMIAVAIAGGAVAFASTAQAQAPQAENNISMGMALAILQGTLEQCTKDGYKVSVSVVDKGGVLAGFVRGDGTSPHTVEFSRMKAYTSRVSGRTTLEFIQYIATPQGEWAKQLPGTVSVGGGVPIKKGNEVIGAVGVSGAPGGDKDEACAKAGIDKVAAQLR
jgi:uncharacterized protein GlcG (DUF336 family)